MGWLLAATLALAGQLQVGLAGGAILGDLAAAGLIAWWLAVPVADHGRRLGHELLVPLVLIVSGSLLAITGTGVTSWGLRDLILDAAAILTLLAAVGTAGMASAQQFRLFRGALILSLAVVTVHLALTSGQQLRSGRGLSQPEPGRPLPRSPRRRRSLPMLRNRGQRGATLAVGTVAWAMTGSYGALLQALVMITYWLAKHRRRREFISFSALVTAPAALPVFLGRAPTSLSIGRLLPPTGSTAAGEGRFQKWVDGLAVFADRPLGVGPGSVKALRLSDNELHNE